MPLEIGKVVEGKVSGITKFGAFVELPEGNKGLVHISEISSEYVKDISDHLEENQKVKVKILSMDDKGRISLSIRKAEGKPRFTKRPPAEIDWSKKDTDLAMSFEDKLSKFMKDSDEKLLDLKKSFDSKRGGRGYSRKHA